MGRKNDRAYLHKESNEVLKVQRINDTRVVVNFPSGPERLSQSDLNHEFEHLGDWEDYENGMLTSREL